MIAGHCEKPDQKPTDLKEESGNKVDDERRKQQAKVVSFRF